MKTHRFDTYGPACGTADGVNAALMDPPEVTCRRCPKVAFNPYDLRHYARAEGRVFIVEGLPPDPERPWTAKWEGKL